MLLTTPLLLSLAGCHVVEKAKQCAHLSSLMKQAAPQLSPQLPEFPSSQSLQHKAGLFAQLGKKLRGAPVSDAHVRENRDQVAVQLTEIEKGLLDAETQVREERARLSRLEKRERQLDDQRKTPAQNVAPKSIYVSRYMRAKSGVVVANQRLEDALKSLEGSCR
jgi:hypothetical protein